MFYDILYTSHEDDYKAVKHSRFFADSKDEALQMSRGELRNVRLISINPANYVFL